MAKHGTGTWTYYIICAYTSLRHWVCLGDRGRWEVRKAKVIPCGSFARFVGERRAGGACERRASSVDPRAERTAISRTVRIERKSNALGLARRSHGSSQYAHTRRFDMMNKLHQHVYTSTAVSSTVSRPPVESPAHSPVSCAAWDLLSARWEHPPSGRQPPSGLSRGHSPRGPPPTPC